MPYTQWIMANLTLEQLQKALDKGFKNQNFNMQKGFDGLARDLKMFIKDQDDELGRIVKAGFDDVFKRLDVTKRIERLEKFRDIVAQALNIQA